MSISRKGPKARLPPVAAVTKISMGDNSLKTVSTALRSKTSQARKLTPEGTVPALSGLRLTAVTSAPFLAKSKAAANPMPDVPPKTTAFLPDKSI